MNTSDLVNGIFEGGGALATALSISRLWKDKEIRGVHWMATFYFFSWSCWNLLWYHDLKQPISFIGAILMASMNAVWLLSLLYFTQRKQDGNAAPYWPEP